jgi:uncharacterized protein
VAASPYVIGVAVLLRDMPATSRVTLRAPFDAEHEFSPRGPAETDVRPDDEVDVNLTLESYPGGIRARGTVTTPWHGVCRRCSATIEGSSVITVDERFVDPKGLVDEDSYPIADDHIDLAPMVHDAVFLDLPLAPLCKEDCAGLCVQCGADLNEGPCGCLPPKDPRWAMLEDLLGDN